MNFICKLIKFNKMSHEKYTDKKFFTYSWHIDEEEKNITVIRIYGLDENNENVCVIVNDFTPYVYLQLPEDVKWDSSSAQLLGGYIDRLLTGSKRDTNYNKKEQEQDRTPVVKKLMWKKRLYYATSTDKETFPYLMCAFNHQQDIRELSYKLRRPIMIPGLFNEAKIIKMHENNASPVLQMTSLRKISTAGWVSFDTLDSRVKTVKSGSKTTYAKHEYIVSWKCLNPVESDKVARPLLMGYDIEVNSSIPTSMPNHNRPEDVVFQISCVFGRQGSKQETYENYILTLGKIDEKILNGRKARNPEGKEKPENLIKAISYDTEADLLLGFVKLMQEKQPNICIGYNIFTFDIPYMIERAVSSFCIYDFDKQGMNIGGHAKRKEIDWSSSAYKNQKFQFLDAEGRIFVDLLPLVRRDYKLSNYKLKTIASHFLKDLTKDPLDAKGIFRCYKLGMKGGKLGEEALGVCGAYCYKDSLLVMRLFEILTTWVALTEMSKVTNVPIFSLYTQGQQLKIFSQVYRKATHENIVVERDAYVVKDTDHYVGATVLPAKGGLYNWVLPYDFSSLYPSIIIAYNMCWSTLVTNDKIPNSKCHVMSWDDHINCNHDPRMIKIAKLTETIKEKEELLKKLRKERDLKKNLLNKESFVLKINELIKEIKPIREERVLLKKGKSKHVICCERKYRWLKEPIGVLPENLKNLLDTRASTRKLMKTVKQDIEKETNIEKKEELETYYSVLDQRQLALKISANSGYGITGARKGMLTCMPVAMCTTYIGRCSIEKASKCIQDEHKGVLVYGDTDSAYMSFPFLKTAQECWDYASKVAVEVSKLFPKPMSLAYEEKIYWKFMLLTKKRYMSLGCQKDGSIDKKIAKKGVLLQRRDTCNFIRNVYEKVIMMLFDMKQKEEVFYFIISQLNILCAGGFPKEEFIITKSVGEITRDDDGRLIPTIGTNDKGKECYKIGDYTVKLLPVDLESRDKQYKLKNCQGLNDTEQEQDYYLHSLPAQAQLAEKMRSRGQLVASGSRIEYIITTTGGHTAKQYVKVEDADYFTKHTDTLKIDFLYYLKQLSNPLDQVLDIMFPITRKAYDTPLFTTQQYKIRLVYKNVVDTIKKLYSPNIVIKE
jgi:DNA polymerase elongation subunit (family B)